jgi:hypothetical protein
VKDGPSYLKEAARAGNYATAKMLLAAGAKIHGEWSALDINIQAMEGLRLGAHPR